MGLVMEIPIFGGPDDGGAFTVALDADGHPPETVYRLRSGAPRLMGPLGMTCPGVDRVEYRRQRFFNPWSPGDGVRWRYVHPDLRP